MALKQHSTSTSVVYELMDKDGFELWKKDNKLSESNSDVMLTRFFKKRDDMTADDFAKGIDPLHEEDDE